MITVPAQAARVPVPVPVPVPAQTQAQVQVRVVGIKRVVVLRRKWQEVGAAVEVALAKQAANRQLKTSREVKEEVGGTL